MPVFLRVLLIVLCLPFPAVAQGATPANGNPQAPGVRRFAVTLLSSFDPIPEKLLPADVPKKVYRTKASIFGRTIHFARVGFYATAGEAEAARAKLLPRYPAAFVTEITSEEYREATGGAQPATAPATRAPATDPDVIAPKPAARDEIFVLTLVSDPARAPQPVAPLPDALRGYRLYTHVRTENGTAGHTLNLGFFATPTEAERARRMLRADYPEAQVRPVSQAERDASVRSVVRAPAAAPAPPPAPVTPVAPIPAPAIAAAGPATVESEAVTLIDRARDALTRGDNMAAIQVLGQLLQLPPNRQTQEAQELIGLAHERNGERARARREYELYLKLYPEGPASERVRQRLASLDAPGPAPTLKAARKRDTRVIATYGSFSQYYYRGDSRIETTTQVGPTLNQDTLSLIDQSALITNLDLNGRIRSGDWDNRLVIRDSYTLNFLEGTENQNRLYSAYGELRNKTFDYGGRFGRQPGNTGGVLGRFDGVSMGYGFLPKWRLNLVAGEPVEFNPINSDKLFWGTNVDFGTFAEHWSGNLYYMQQTVDDILDRQAVGSELRYFDPKRNAFILIDYDLSFSELNIALFQLTRLFGTRTSLNVLVDHRKAPILQTSNAVIGEIDTSITSQLQTLSEDELRSRAEARTPTSDLYLLGVNHNFTSKWQLGGDIKLYNISGTPASGTLPETVGTGNILVYTLQGIATTLFSKRDISVLSLSYLDSRSYTGQSVALSNRTLLRDKWTLDFSLRYYTQQDNAGTDLTRWNPTLRLGYRWRERLTLEGEYGLEKTLTESATSSDDSTRNYFSLGYRWDF